MAAVKLNDDLTEATAISTLICHPEFIFQGTQLNPRYFFRQDNQCIYWAISELYKNGIDNIDSVNLLNMLNSNSWTRKTIEKFGIDNMEEYIGYCTKSARHTVDEYKALAKQIKTLAFKRSYTKLMDNLQNTCTEDIDLSALSTNTYSKLSKLTEEFVVDESVEVFGDKVDALWDEIESRRSEDGLYGIPSKFEKLNSYMTYEPTELVLLKARMKKGKSAWMMNEAIHKIKLGIPTVYFDTEMSDRLFFERMLANVSGVRIKDIKSGRYSKEEAKKIEEAKQWIKKTPFVHIYDPQFTNDKIYATCNILKYKMNLEFVIYDYIKSNTTDSSAQYNELGSKCDFLKNNIAGDLDLAVLAACQLNRNNEVADSDKIERYCSVSLLWQNKSADNIMVDGTECGNFKLTVNLNRLGDQMADDDYIDFNFDGNVMQINETVTQHGKTEPDF